MPAKRIRGTVKTKVTLICARHFDHRQLGSVQKRHFAINDHYLITENFWKKNVSNKESISIIKCSKGSCRKQRFNFSDCRRIEYSEIVITYSQTFKDGKT